MDKKRKEIAEKNSTRDEKVEEQLVVALDKGERPGHYWDAILTHSIKRASESANKLSRRIYWLNWILVALGVLYILTTEPGKKFLGLLTGLFKMIFH